MSTFEKYLRLPFRRKRLLHAALAWLILSRIGLALFSLPALQRRFLFRGVPCRRALQRL